MFEVLSGNLDNIEILKNKKSLKAKFVKPDNVKVKILVLCGSTVAELKDFLHLFLLANGIDAEIIESTYNSYYEDILFSQIIEKEQPDWVYIHSTSKNIVNWPEPNMSSDDLNTAFLAEESRILSIIDSISNKNAKFILNNFEYPEFRLYGNYDCVSETGWVNYVNRLNAVIAEEISKHSNIYINDIMYLSSQLGHNQWFDSSYWHLFKYAVSPRSLPYLGRSLANIIKSVLGKSHKVLVCDLDNTLWGGVIGDDGVDNIEIGAGSPRGEAFGSLQKYISLLCQRGVILAVNSKNQSDIALSGLEHKFSILKENDFSSFQATWNAKSENMYEIEDELNISHESFVFIDDNPAEIDQVRSVLPSIHSVSYKSSPIELISSIDQSGFFELSSLSGEDLKRSELYSNRAKAKKLRSTSLSLKEYLISLKMKAYITFVDTTNAIRAEQLTNKTNQFNLTQLQINSEKLLGYGGSSNEKFGLVASLDDIYGSHGITSVILLSKNRTVLNVDSWVMSCRVFNRNYEFAIFDEVVRRCTELQVDTIQAEYRKTKKNAYVENLYESLGFELLSVSESKKKYVLNLENYTQKNKVIEVDND